MAENRFRPNHAVIGLGIAVALFTAASGVASQALRGGDVVGPSSGQAAVGPAGHACARMAPTAALEPKAAQTAPRVLVGASTLPTARWATAEHANDE